MPRKVALLGVHQGLAGAIVGGQQPADVAVDQVEALVKPLIIYFSNTPWISGEFQGKGGNPAGVGISGQGRQQVAAAKRIDHRVRQTAGAQGRQERLGPRQVHAAISRHARLERLAMPGDDLGVEIGGQGGVAAASHDAIEEFGFGGKILALRAVRLRRRRAGGRKEDAEGRQ